MTSALRPLVARAQADWEALRLRQYEEEQESRYLVKINDFEVDVEDIKVGQTRQRKVGQTRQRFVGADTVDVTRTSTTSVSIRGPVNSAAKIRDSQITAFSVVPREGARSRDYDDALYQLGESLIKQTIALRRVAESVQRVRPKGSKDQKTQPAAAGAALKEDDVCKICMAAPKTGVFTPCGHLVCCIPCGQKLTRCPICRAVPQAFSPLAFIDQSTQLVFFS
jgi:hypothetical protein